MKKNSVLVLFVLFASLLNAQSSQGLDEKLYQSLHGHGSLNAVIAVIVVILSILFLALFRIEKKIGKLEQEMKENKK
ncbi:MAG: hypothetical protein HY064_04175 [Bacteroidetes bacterium]|nr:hypothetical protein [Bacteroidota bacterium]